MAARFAVLGDVHTFFDDADIEQLDGLGYDAILFVGDLAGFRPGTDVATARRIARLSTPCFVQPGNHDAVTPPQLLAEILSSRVLSRLFAVGQRGRVAKLDRALGDHVLTGYSVHELTAELSLIAARPHSFGGDSLSCAKYIADRFGVRSLAESADRIATLIRTAPAREVVVLAHNGPYGLGATPHDIWGCDFAPDRGDFGDPDLADALGRATKTVRAVVAGHMHHHVKRSKTPRSWWARRNGTLFVNAAAVPRIRNKQEGACHHHVRLTIEAARAMAEQVWLEGDSAEVVARTDDEMMS